MQFKSLTVAAFILGLGVVAGCDDPEVQSKVMGIMEHGLVDAYMECTNLSWNACTPVQMLQLKVNKFIDGSCYFDITGNGNTYSPTFHGFQHKGKGYLEFSTVMSNSGAWSAEIADGVIEITAECVGNTPPVESDTDLLEGSCTGYNLEAFGTTP